ncbi:ABC transporter permease [Arthrobacter sp. EpRS71]|uniref:ABC transporter permease n=1 Tax=Arthrobacter sp. EpRS71 TaxID=1743141 RepID=UPI00074AE40A|nr:ABC transporter permease [Arthrobacter sp. EpRS71]KUM38052.1 ABC transporter permease [Arthrobacter sp. EpRS71]
MGWALLGSELSVLFRRLRTWAMLIALAAVPILIAVAVKLSSRPTAPGRGPLFLDRITQNGLFVAVTALVVCVPLFLPLTVGVVAGDTIAGEANLGTLRYLLIAPAGRIRLLLVKYAGAVAFCCAATATVAASGALAGVVLFPVGPVTLLSGDTISVGESALRSLLIAAYITVSLLGLSAIGLLISTPVGAMAATIVLSVVSQVLDNLPQLEWLHPWLFSHHWLSFADLLRQPISWTSFGENALLQAGYIAVCGALAYAKFSNKDVLS